ncbi:hypothetical protein bthur0004_8860 [Bacillus thuringiensis serovar sotto str. T04001]|nr:hypothetical protein bthur0004_8860 [Bacillus thuringiensis serovar sotto str. T04001]
MNILIRFSLGIAFTKWLLSWIGAIFARFHLKFEWLIEKI